MEVSMDGKKVVLLSVFSIFIFPTGFYTSEFFQDASKPVQVTAPKTPNNNYTNEENFSAKILALEQENASLKNTLSARKVTSELMLAQPTPTLNQANFDLATQQKIEKLSADLSEKLAKKMQQSPGYHLNADLAEQFSQEPIDSDWALQHESKLHDFINSQEKLRNITPESITCRTEKCRIRVPIANLSEANETAMTLVNSLNANNDISSARRALSAIDTKQGIVDIYIAKNAEVNLLK